MTISGERPFRFGVNMLAPGARDEWIAKCRRAEAAGYDVVAVADHLGMPPPFPALVLAAGATERVRLGTFVLNTAFYNPTLLAREVAGTDSFTGGRFELGLGAGYVKDEFDTAGLPFETAGRRVDHLQATIAELRRAFAESAPAPMQNGGPPLLLGGRGDRMLRLAAREAQIIAFSGVAPGEDGSADLRLAEADAVAERVDYVNTHIGDREVEYNILVQRVVLTENREATAHEFATALPYLSAEQVLELPSALIGTPEQIADQLRANRKRFGFSYITVLEDSLDAFAEVIPHLR